MKILITGVAGFIGHRLAHKFLAQGHNVIGIDIQSCDKSLINHDSFSYLKTDICDSKQVNTINFSFFDFVYHMAAAGVKASNRQWNICCMVNVLGTTNIIQALARTDPIQRPTLLYTRTFYEDHIDDFPRLQNNPYIMTKASATACVRTYACNENAKVKIAKVYQVFGPGDNDNNVLTYAVRQFIAKKSAEFSSGKGRRDWIFVDDFIEGLVACTYTDQDKNAEYDLGSGDLLSIRSVVEKLAILIGVKSNYLIFNPEKDRGDSDIIDSASSLPPGWLPKLSLEEGLKRLIETEISIN